MSVRSPQTGQFTLLIAPEPVVASPRTRMRVPQLEVHSKTTNLSWLLSIFM